MNPTVSEVHVNVPISPAESKLTPERLKAVHDLLAAEMKRRGMRHITPLEKVIQRRTDMATDEDFEKAYVEIFKPYPNEHACRLKPPTGYQRMRRQNAKLQHDGKPIDVIFGVREDGSSEIQAFRYPKDKWMAPAAETHCQEHDGAFEAAAEMEKTHEPVSKPYATLADLPATVKKLPKHGQEIWRAAFNAAWQEYEGDEAKAHATAWAAVKTQYRQQADGAWVAKAKEDWFRGGKSRVMFAHIANSSGKLWCRLSRGRTASPGASWELFCPILKADKEKRLVYGIVLEPGTPRRTDSQGDFIKAEEIEEACHDFMARWKEQKAAIGRQHKEPLAADIVECYLAPQDMNMGENPVKKGSWVLAVKVNDDQAWSDVKAGRLTGYSIGGWGERKELVK